MKFSVSKGLAVSGAALLLSTLSALVFASTSTEKNHHYFHAALDEALAEVRPDYEQRLILVEQARDFLAVQEDASVGLQHKADMVEALAHMRLGRFELSFDQTQLFCPAVDATAFPDLHFRCNVLLASLLVIRGDRAESLAMFEALFARDLSAVTDHLIKRYMLSYAVVLHENGKSAQAVDLYEDILLDALADGNDELTLLAGNNMIVILINQYDFIAARQTMQRLEPALARSPDSLVRGSLLLHQYELARLDGKVDEAVIGFESFIENKVDDTPLMMGSAHKLLADAYRDRGDLARAADSAQQALNILQGQAHEVNDARLTLARIYIDQGSYLAAMELMEKIDVDAEAVPTRRALIFQLDLEAKLRNLGDQSVLDSFSRFVKADAERDELASTTRAEYLQARVTAMERGQELERAEARVRAQEQQQLVERRNSRMVMLLVGLVALAIVMAAYTAVRRRAEVERIREKDLQNERLEAIVEQKTQELRENLLLQAEIARSLERTKRIEAVGMLAGNVAHDFNNLLQVIAGSNETLARRDTDESERAEMLELSNTSVDHAARIVRQLLAFSRQQNLAPSPLCFSDFLAENKALLRSALGEESDLKFRDYSDGAKVIVDSAQLTTSIINLVSNAADAMPAGGIATITAMVVQLDEVSIKPWHDIQAGDFLSIVVSDTGQGMSGDQIARAFEPFFTTKGEFSGTGLGLSSVHGFVKQSGGDIDIRSRQGRGTEVEILLPITDLAVTRSQPEVAQDSIGLAGKRVLLVEDNESVASLLETLLAKLQLEAVKVHSGEAAKRQLSEGERFDILLTDVRMPGDLNGPDLALWAIERVPDMTVLLMSGFTDAPIENTDLPLIRKPFTLEQLQAFLLHHLGLETAATQEAQAE